MNGVTERLDSSKHLIYSNVNVASDSLLCKCLRLFLLRLKKNLPKGEKLLTEEKEIHFLFLLRKGGEKIAEEQKPKREPKLVDVGETSVEIPQYGDKLPAKVTRLGMTTALEMFAEKARNPDQEVMVVFFATDDGVKGQTPMSYYKHPSHRSNIAKFVRKYGQPKVGMVVTIIRDENGFWGLDL